MPEEEGVSMVKVECKVCGLIGYTASPNTVTCECGSSKFKVMPENGQREKVELSAEDQRLYDTSGFIK